MLAFVDLPKGIRITRVEELEDGIQRTNLGRVNKSAMVIESPLAEALTEDEKVEVQKIIDAYQEATVVRRRAAALNLPVTLREAMEYFESDASEIEKTFVVGAVMEAVRRIRKMDRGGGES